MWAFDLEAQRLVRIARGRCGTPSVSGTTLAYRDADGTHCLDLQSGKELRLVPGNASGPPMVSAERVLWIDEAADGAGYDLWVCDVAGGEKRILTSLRDIDPSVGTPVSGAWFVYVGVPDDAGVVPVTAVDLSSGEHSRVASQKGLLVGVAVTAE